MSIANAFTNASESFKAKNKHLGLLPRDARLLRSSVNPEPGKLGKRQGQATMNKTEAEYSLILEAMKRKGEILDWKFEGIKLKIGEGCFYTPDFMVTEQTDSTYRDGCEFITRVKFIEVKGFLRDDARVKFLAAQEQHKWASFEMWRRDRKTGWTQIL